MIQAFQSYIATNKLFTKEDRLLVAVSGGRDSMLLVDLLFQLGYDFGIAHVNYQLRGEDSESDEEFVRQFCEKYTIPFFVSRADIQFFKKEIRVSTQMAARTIRYEWFEKIRQENGYQYILTAHHLADSVETVLLHLARGTGLTGLHGILPVQGVVRRPLLFATKEDMQTYVLDRKVVWRDDVSNFKTDYARNKVRLQIIPLLEQINPSFQKNIARMGKFTELSAQLVQSQISDFLSTYRKVTNWNEEIIDIEVIRQRKEKELILFDWLYAKGFSPKVIECLDEWLEIDRTESKLFHSATHTLEISRSQMRLKENISSFSEIDISIDGDEVPCKKGNLSFTIGTERPTRFDFDTLYIDIVDVHWPLKVRKWQLGDKMRPFGMAGRKKISDILIDQKVPIGEKSRIFVLEDKKGEILWLIGKKQSEKARIHSNTRLILQVKLDDIFFIH